MGDKRLSSRLVDCVDAKSKKPDLTFSGVAKGDWPAVKGYYRLIDHPNESAINMGNILLPHRELYDTAHERAKDSAVYPGWQ